MSPEFQKFSQAPQKSLNPNFTLTRSITFSISPLVNFSNSLTRKFITQKLAEGYKILSHKRSERNLIDDS